jgi:hypothetical protein
MSKSYAFTALAGIYLASCQSHRPLLIENYTQAQKLVPLYERQYSKNKKPVPWVGPWPAPALRLRRAHPASPALLLGHVALVLENGKLLSQPSATVLIDKQAITADEAGNYAVELPPGRHALRSGGVGFLWSQAPLLQVVAGDSIRLDFRLLADIRPIID